MVWMMQPEAGMKSALSGRMHEQLARPKRGLLRYAMDRHHELEDACRDLRVDASHWDGLVASLREHMAAEEELIIPAFQLSDPEEADELRNEHAHLRELLDEIDEHVHRHGVHAERLRRLDTALRAHAAREDASLYPWAERHLPLVARRQLLLRISHWLRRRGATR